MGDREERKRCQIMSDFSFLIQGSLHLENALKTSLVVQWLRVCLLMQGTWVRSLIQEDPTGHGETDPVGEPKHLRACAP